MDDSMPQNETQEPEKGETVSDDASEREENSQDTDMTREELVEQVKKWKNLSRKNEERMKANAEKAKAYDEYLQSQKTEEEKHADALKKARDEAREATTRALKAEAGLEYGLTREDLDLLGDGDPDTFSERAKRLSERIKTQRGHWRDPNLGRENKGATPDWIRQSLQR